MNPADILQPPEREAVSLPALFGTFLKIGSTAFGGFMALIAVVENYVVERKNYLRHEEILDGISLATILPGPVAVNVVAFVGYRLRKGLGALVCATAVILPSFLLLLVLSALYFQYGQLPAVEKLFRGFIPAVSAIIATTVFNMGRKTIQTPLEAAISLVSCVLLLTVGGFAATIGIVLGCAVLGRMLFGAPNRNSPPTEKKEIKTPLFKEAMSGPLAVLVLGTGNTLGTMSFTFAWMSLMLFGGGYVFIPLIQEVVVSGYGWVTNQEFIDGIALGQVTPGPILISAAFIGYKVGGIAGATCATIGIFTPPALVMLACAASMEKIKSSATLKACLRGVRLGVIGMIAAAAVKVGLSAPHTALSLIIFALAFTALMRFKVEIVWIIPAAGLLGVVLS